jgi:hypothetical protein
VAVSDWPEIAALGKTNVLASNGNKKRRSRAPFLFALANETIKYFLSRQNEEIKYF